MAKTINLFRVPYGKASTPAKDREYQSTSGGAVGTKKEWHKFLKEGSIKPKFHEKSLGIQGYFRR